VIPVDDGRYGMLELIKKPDPIVFNVIGISADIFILLFLAYLSAGLNFTTIYKNLDRSDALYPSIFCLCSSSPHSSLVLNSNSDSLISSKNYEDGSENSLSVDDRRAYLEQRRMNLVMRRRNE
jgi:hypothetical protein